MSIRPTISIACVDDHEMLLDGMATRIASEPDLRLVGRLSSADLLVERAREWKPDVILLDIEMPGADPLQQVARLAVAMPDIAVIIVTAFVRDHYIDTALDHGVLGFFSKCDPPSEIIAGIRRVHLGRPALGPSVAARLDPERISRGRKLRDRSRLGALSPRELEVLRLVGRGMSRAEISKMACRSRKTIDAQHTSIMRKLDIHDRAELTRFAIGEGLVEA
ncbi:MAG: response regulator transcription factor [Phycisphaerae bacterium]|nr:response regulator transcription factor [Phycisphaerae bacterium]